LHKYVGQQIPWAGSAFFVTSKIFLDVLHAGTIQFPLLNEAGSRPHMVFGGMRNKEEVQEQIMLVPSQVRGIEGRSRFP
jgi:hypothetical protein